MYNRLQKVGLCLSHRSTIRLVDKFGEGFDQKVVQWKTEIEETMDASVIVVHLVIICLPMIYCTLFFF